MDFSLPILGLKPDNTYSIRLKLTDQNNQQLDLLPALKAVTIPLPDDFPDIKVLISKPALALLANRRRSSASFLIGR